MLSPLSAPTPPPSSSSPSSYPDYVSSFDFIRMNLIPIFFAVLGASSILWMIGFKFIFTKAVIVRFFKSLGVSNPRTRKAFTELKRKSFHLMGLLIPFIYYLGLHYSNGFITRPFGLLMLGALTTFLWIVEILRYVSPSFRGHYNRLFSSVMRKSELAVDPSMDTAEGSLAHQVDQIVQSITTPLLGELPTSNSLTPKSSESNLHLRTHVAAAQMQAQVNGTSNATSIASAFSTPEEYNKYAGKPGAVAAVAAAVAPPVQTEKVFTGTGFFFLGNWLSMLLFSPTIATCSMLFLVLGDMSAAIIGISFGTIKIGKKSLEGTVAMWFVCYLIGSIFFFSVSGSSSVVFLAALAATLVELLGPDRWFLDDNITIPLTSGFAFTMAFNLIAGGVPAEKY